VTDVTKGGRCVVPAREGRGTGGPGEAHRYGPGPRAGKPAPDPTATITVERDGKKKERLFNPYNGQDLGDNTTAGQFFILWIVRLHDELLMDRPDGPWWNGSPESSFLAAVVPDLVVWWPGVYAWKRSLAFKWSPAGGG
jgi:uncharacterized iron-regulated membrane protein